MVKRDISGKPPGSYNALNRRNRCILSQPNGKTMKTTLLIAFASLVLVFAADTVHACSCRIEPNKPEISYTSWARSFKGAAFSGRVLSVEPSEHQMMSKVTFSVSEHWRGVEGDKAVIYTPENSAMCGVGFDVGKDYVVIADSDGKKFSVYSCPSIEYVRHQDKYLNALGTSKRTFAASRTEPRKFDEFGKVNCEEELSRLDALSFQLQNDPSATAHIFIYGGKVGKRNEARARGVRMTYYLSKIRGVDKSRFKTFDGGYRDTFSGEIWLVKPGDSTPKAAPTVDAKDVTLKGKASVRGYNCGDDMGRSH